MNPSIPFALPDIGPEEIDEVIDTLKSSWLASGPKTIRFEEQFAKYINTRHALAVSSATAGLHLALEAIGLKRGEKVIVPVNTFTATAEVVRYFDADPIFCDVDEINFNISVREVAAILNHHPERHLIKAIIPVHIAGHICDMSSIMKLAKEYDLKVIEDAAHAFPAALDEKFAGTLGDIGVFSFYATKTLCTGDGGMVVTNNPEFADRIKIMRQHGLERDSWDRYQATQPKWFYSVVAAGFKYKMNDIAASLGIHQLDKADIFLARRKIIAERYHEAFSCLKGVTLPAIFDAHQNLSYHLFIIKIDKRDEFIQKMSEEGIGTSVHFIPLHLHRYWKETYCLADDDFPIALANFNRIVSLPIYSKMSDMEVDRVIMSVKRIVGDLDLS